MELSDKARDLLVALAAELMTDEEVVQLAAHGKKTIVSHHGVATYGKPLGTEITPDMEMELHAKKTGLINPHGITKDYTPAAVPEGKTMPLKKRVHVHPRIPGAKIYEFEDGSMVVEDPHGRRSEQKKGNPQHLADLGWRVHGDGPTSQDDVDAEERTKTAKSKIKTLKGSTGKHPKYSQALSDFEEHGDRINEMLRKGDDHGEHFDTVNNLRSLMDNSKTTEHTTVHRGMAFSSAEDRDLYVSQVLRPGNRFRDKGFVTATTHPDVALQHADSGGVDSSGVVVNIDVPKGSRAAALHHASGKDGDDNDHEVMLGDDGEYVVKDVEQDEKGRHIAHVTYIDHHSGKSALERVADADATPDRVKERRRAQRFAWHPHSITITGEDGKPIALDTTQQTPNTRGTKGGGSNGDKRGGGR